MPDIVLSYNREDQARAKLFAEAFEREGFSVWWDVGLKTGEAYDQVTEKALREAKAVVVLWSKRSVESRWVRAEATLADRNKTLVPCMIEPCERPIMFELTQTAELAHWTGDAGDKSWQAFLGDVRRFVGGEVAAARPAEVNPTPAGVQETLKPGQRGDAPSLAVLPFTNRSGQADDEIFAIGLVEDVISALSQGADVRVLGASATASLTKGAITDLAAVGRQLGVHYLLEGNVRRVATALRVSAQLLEAESGAVLWAGKFDRLLSELAELQEELVLDLAATLNVEVSNIEVARALQKPEDITVWRLLKRSQYFGFSADPVVSHVASLEESERALAIAPDYPLAIAITANNLASAILFAGHDDLETITRARALAERALKLAPNDAEILAAAGHVFGIVGDWIEAYRHTSRAVQKMPGSGMVHFWHTIASGNVRGPEEGLRHAMTAERLMPGSHMLRLTHFWQAEFLRRLGRYAEADVHADEAIARFDSPNLHLLKAQIALGAGDEAKARKHFATARQSGLPLSRYEAIFLRITAPGPSRDGWLGDLRRYWNEVEPRA